jgi:hypothetical protein
MARFPWSTGAVGLAVSLSGALAAACGTSEAALRETVMGAPCTCGYDAPPPGDWLCSPSAGPCGFPLSCIDGICTITCSLDAGSPDAGTCPTGYECRQTAHSNLAVYCAPTAADGG